ncbi:MAG: VanZ family protein [Anaerolineae bacterium]|nr:VanZ family protein [Anaerolineae bacterium]
MKRYAVLSPLSWIGMLVWGVFVLLLTTLPGSVPLVRVLAAAIGNNENSGVFGHIGLFTILTLLTWRALCQWFRPHHALLIAMSFALLTGTSTELFQWFVIDRDSNISDLMGNWLGVFSMGFAISFHYMRGKKPERA